MPIKDLTETISISAKGTTYSDPVESGHFASREIECSINITALAGTAPTFRVIPQYSYDKVTWFDQPDIFKFDEIAPGDIPHNQTLQLTTTGIYMRFKYLADGTAVTNVAGTIWAVMKS